MYDYLAGDVAPEGVAVSPLSLGGHRARLHRHVTVLSLQATADRVVIQTAGGRDVAHGWTDTVR